MDAVVIGILMLIEYMPDLVGNSMEEFNNWRKRKNLETAQRRKKIRERVSENPKLFIGKTLTELNEMGISVNQADFNRIISPAVRNLTDSKKTCKEFKLFDLPERKLRSDQSEMEEESQLDFTFSSATEEIDLIQSEMETRNSAIDIKTQLQDALKINEAQKIEIE